MASQLKNGLCCLKHYLGVYEQNIRENSIHADDWTSKLAIIASNGKLGYLCLH